MSIKPRIRMQRDKHEYDFYQRSKCEEDMSTWWTCDNGFDHVIGIGFSPIEAYNSWLLGMEQTLQSRRSWISRIIRFVRPGQ